jgi:hypothetical protein
MLADNTADSRTNITEHCSGFPVMPTLHCDTYFDMSTPHVSAPDSRAAHEGK